MYKRRDEHFIIILMGILDGIIDIQLICLFVPSTYFVFPTDGFENSYITIVSQLNHSYIPK